MSDILEVLSKLEFNGTVDAKSFINQIFFGQDETYLNDLRKTFKSKFLNKFEKELRSLETEDIKRIFDPLGLSKTVRNVDELKKDLQDYKSKLKQSLKKANKDIDDLSNLSSISNLRETSTVKNDENTSNIKESSTTKKDENLSEQKTLGEKTTTIKFSEETSSYVDGLFDTYLNKVVEKNNKAEEISKDNNIILDKRTGSGFFDGLLGTLTTILLGGVGATLLAANWSDNVKPWLEDFFGTKLDFLDKFMGIVEGIGKFFTTSGLSLFGIVSKTFGNFLETSLSIFFKGGVGAVIGSGAEAASKVGIKTLLPSIAGNLFRGLGLVALKAAPGIGALISFYFAYDRYTKGDYIGSLIDVVGGIGSLLQFSPLAPLGIGLSIGAAVLNGFLDYKAEGKTPEEQQKSKLNILKNIGPAIYNFIKEIPLIGSIVKGAEAYVKFSYAMMSGGNAGDVISSLKAMEGTPFSILSSFLLPFYEQGVSTDSRGNKKITFGNLYKALGKKIISGMPDWLKSIVAPFFGIDSAVEEIPAIESSKDLKNKIFENKHLMRKKTEQLNSGGVLDSDRMQAEKDLEFLNKRQKELEKLQDTYAQESGEKATKRGQERVQAELDRAKKLDEDFKNRPKEPTPRIIPKYDESGKINPRGGQLEWPEEKVDDNEERGEVKIFNGKTVKSTNPEDVTFSAKPNGFLDKGLKNLFDVMSSVDSKLSVLIKNQNNQSSVVVNNSTVTQSGNSNKEYLMSPVRDSNWINRMNYYSSANQLKVV
jgi:hypothetical protein